MKLFKKKISKTLSVSLSFFTILTNSTFAADELLKSQNLKSSQNYEKKDLKLNQKIKSSSSLDSLSNKQSDLPEGTDSSFKSISEDSNGESKTIDEKSSLVSKDSVSKINDSRNKSKRSKKKVLNFEDKALKIDDSKLSDQKSELFDSKTNLMDKEHEGLDSISKDLVSDFTGDVVNEPEKENLNGDVINQNVLSTQIQEQTDDKKISGKTVGIIAGSIGGVAALSTILGLVLKFSKRSDNTNNRVIELLNDRESIKNIRNIENLSELKEKDKIWMKSLLSEIFKLYKANENLELSNEEKEKLIEFIKKIKSEDAKVINEVFVFLFSKKIIDPNTDFKNFSNFFDFDQSKFPKIVVNFKGFADVFYSVFTEMSNPFSVIKSFENVDFEEKEKEIKDIKIKEIKEEIKEEEKENEPKKSPTQSKEVPNVNVKQPVQQHIQKQVTEAAPVKQQTQQQTSPNFFFKKPSLKKEEEVEECDFVSYIKEIESNSAEFIKFKSSNDMLMARLEVFVDWLFSFCEYSGYSGNDGKDLLFQDSCGNFASSLSTFKSIFRGSFIPRDVYEENLKEEVARPLRFKDYSRSSENFDSVEKFKENQNKFWLKKSLDRMAKELREPFINALFERIADGRLKNYFKNLRPNDIGSFYSSLSHFPPDINIQDITDNIPIFFALYDENLFYLLYKNENKEEILNATKKQKMLREKYWFPGDVVVNNGNPNTPEGKLFDFYERTVNIIYKLQCKAEIFNKKLLSSGIRIKNDKIKEYEEYQKYLKNKENYEKKLKTYNEEMKKFKAGKIKEEPTKPYDPSIMVDKIEFSPWEKEFNSFSFLFSNFFEKILEKYLDFSFSRTKQHKNCLNKRSPIEISYLSTFMKLFGTTTRIFNAFCNNVSIKLKKVSNPSIHQELLNKYKKLYELGFLNKILDIQKRISFLTRNYNNTITLFKLLDTEVGADQLITFGNFLTYMDPTITYGCNFLHKQKSNFDALLDEFEKLTNEIIELFDLIKLEFYFNI